MAVARLGRIELYYERAGSGPRLLYIPGSGGDLRNKPSIFDGPLGAAFDLLTYDQRGLGRSGKPDAPCSMADYADDAATLMAHHGWDRAVVMGLSFGGMVAQELALRHPQRVSRMVLACTSPGGAGGASYPLHEVQHLEGEDWSRHMLPLSDTRRDAAWQAANPELWAALLAQSAAAPFADEPGHAMGARRQLEARAAHDTWDRLPAITCPVMIAAGRYDGVALPKSQQNMAARIPGARLCWFEGGHMFLNQDPAAAPAIVAFLNGDPG